MSDRDCENCKHKINGMCEKWKCEFEAKEILPSMEELLKRAEAKGRADAVQVCAKIIAKMPSLCERVCPINCEWGTEESCVDSWKKYLMEQIKEK